MSLSDQVKKLPLTPGVYIFIDKNNKPLYVGKATSLRRRVSQYFRPDTDPRIGEMVSKAKKIRHHKVETVLDAIVLEANLIKKYWPKYNVKDKDNRSFIFLVIPKIDYPRPLIVRGRELEKFPPSSAKIFGPYQSQTIIKNALKIIRRVFPYGTCKPLSGRACFDYHIGLCPGACVGAISKEDYQKNIDNIILFLKGEKKRLLKKLAKENPSAAAALKHIQDVTLISREDVGPVTFHRIEGYDISHFAGKESYGSMVVLTNGQPDNSQYRLFKIRTVTNNDLESLKEMVERRFKHPEWPRPDLILIDGGKPQVDFVAKVLDKNRIAIPMLGISKFQNDKLIFPVGTKPNFKELSEINRRALLRTRDEAHRFAIKAHRRRRGKI
ncbi:MAG: GIY-YIG nuclease family protein [Patescibacteria group bacterium]